MFGVNEYYNDLLLEAKTPEEIHKILSYKYKDVVPQETINKVFNLDPTSKKSYTNWLLSKYQNESDFIEGLLRNGGIKAMFKYFFENSDIVQFNRFNTVKEAYKMIPDVDPIFGEHDDVPKEALDYEVVYEDDNWKICVPNTYEASKFLGQDCTWCTANAYGNGEEYYDDFTKKGPLFINFDLTEPQVLHGNTYPYTRYQFSFEGSQWMDAFNEPIAGAESIDMPEGAIEFYESKGYDVNELEDYDTRLERYNEDRIGGGIVLNDDYALMVEYSDDLRYHEGPLYLYATYYDENDPVFPYAIDENNIERISDEVCILKQATEQPNDLIIVVAANNAFETSEYIRLDNDNLIFSSDGDNYVYAVNENGWFEMKLPVKQTAYSIVKNDNAVPSNSNYTAIEVLYDDTPLHTLIWFHNGEYYFAVPFDVPRDGHLFKLSQDGYIYGTFKKYTGVPKRSDNDWDFKNYYGSDEVNDNSDYTTAVEVLPSKNVVLSCEKEFIRHQNFKTNIPFNDYGRPYNRDENFQNVFTIKDGKLEKLFERDFRRLIKEVPSSYKPGLFYCCVAEGINSKERYIVYNEMTGEPIIGPTFNEIYVDDVKKLIFAEKDRDQRIYTAYTETLTGELKKIPNITSFAGRNKSGNRAFLRVNEEGDLGATSCCYLVDENFDILKKIEYLELLGYSSLYFLRFTSNTSIPGVIYDLETDTVLFDNVTDVVCSKYGYTVSRRFFAFCNNHGWNIYFLKLDKCLLTGLPEEPNIKRFEQGYVFLADSGNKLWIITDTSVFPNKYGLDENTFVEHFSRLSEYAGASAEQPILKMTASTTKGYVWVLIDLSNNTIKYQQVDENGWADANDGSDIGKEILSYLYPQQATIAEQFNNMFDKLEAIRKRNAGNKDLLDL